jgi:D-xylose transport system substrate-binding protein
MLALEKMKKRDRVGRPAAARIAAAALVAAFVAAAALPSLTLTGCKPKRHKVATGETPLIGFSMDSLVVERWRRDLDVFTRAANDLGAKVLVEVADQDPAVQEEQVRDLADKGIDVLVIVPNDADRLSAVVREVRAKGLPVLSYDRLVRRAGVDLYVSFDNEKVGYLMAEALLKAVPTGGYVVVNGPRNDNNAILLNAGVHRAIDPFVASGRLRIVAELWPATWDSDEVHAGMESVVEKSAAIDAVISGNDMLAEAAIGVLAESRIAAKVAGQDADLSACQRIAEGSQFLTVYKPIERLALKAAGLAVMLARGESVETESTIDDGMGKVPYVRLEPIPVVKETLMSTVIKDGFHTAAEVYRNASRPAR